MNMNMFEQFMSPELVLIPTAPISMLIPIFMVFHKPKLLGNRTTTSMVLLLKMFMLSMLTQLSPKGQKWCPLLVGLFLMILLSNLLGLLPYTFTPTSQLSMNMALAIPLWLATVILGLKTNPSTSLAHLLPEGSPTPLIPFMIMIETVSLLMRPMALGVRLTANITAGHLLMTMVGSAAINLINTYISMSLLTLTLLFLLTLLELAVACIQAYVFALLVILYLQENS
uniref:ATP synthase subunit a n=1 Tax=Vipera berus TaxID=31155 RepID=A0A343SWD0_VIPBE|nr:ATP synthase F0 subunit 6 [Vipera berus]YP_010263860.1 ATP synthase F0 subunit 6 [Echis carinatus]YP_010263873.1 ATP synthase F0 subunit 6 [Echis coloratus]YP_010384462.1 ATP synthase F0 subunit 6 [Echis omanensis]AUT77196.1 ATP synthase F0 subunit 6 [Vipera berus]QHI42774.1 ATP synthase F0 subunit 6 [Vipera berus]QHI42825.1 ATP synthase F0 subunit 6 [Vipera berus]UGW52621.1 ATP synthase F0 subunit 6 [Echis carinatus]UGW52634.1 ATP synthase F0 subunit 6 [Echis coloratus]